MMTRTLRYCGLRMLKAQGLGYGIKDVQASCMLVKGVVVTVFSRLLDTLPTSSAGITRNT